MLLPILRNKCVVVVGPHRSGTSACAGILHKLGVHMGEVLLKANDKNPKGFFEDLDFCNIHHRMVEDWTNPKIRTERFTTTYENIIKTKNKPLWGFKDPKICVLLDFSIPLLKKYNHILLINVIRPIDEIVQSMTSARFGKKSHFTGAKFDDKLFLKEESEKIAQRYILAKDAFLETYQGKKLDVHYNDLIKDKVRVINEIANFISKPVTDQALAFIEESLKHY